MSHARGQVRFHDGDIKYFEYNGTSDKCKPKLYDTFDEMIDDWRKPYIIEEANNMKCTHNEEDVDIYTDYANGFYWKGTACKKCNMLLKGIDPFDFKISDSPIDGIPKWAEDFNKYYD